MVKSEMPKEPEEWFAANMRKDAFDRLSLEDELYLYCHCCNCDDVSHKDFDADVISYNKDRGLFIELRHFFYEESYTAEDFRGHLMNLANTIMPQVIKRGLARSVDDPLFTVDEYIKMISHAEDLDTKIFRRDALNRQPLFLLMKTWLHEDEAKFRLLFRIFDLSSINVLRRLPGVEPDLIFSRKVDTTIEGFHKNTEGVKAYVKTIEDGWDRIFEYYKSLKAAHTPDPIAGRGPHGLH